MTGCKPWLPVIHCMYKTILLLLESISELAPPLPPPYPPLPPPQELCPVGGELCGTLRRNQHRKTCALVPCPYIEFGEGSLLPPYPLKSYSLSSPPFYLPPFLLSFSPIYFSFTVNLSLSSPSLHQGALFMAHQWKLQSTEDSAPIETSHSFWPLP